MGIFHLTLLLATLLCSLVAGFVFAFTVVVMPGIGKLGDAEFLRSFQTIDRVIQDNQPLFVLVWVGSAVALLVAAALGMGRLEGGARLLLIAATAAYLLGVQLPTVAINIPLNNSVQALDIENVDAAALGAARLAFEPRWNFWNTFRTVVAILVSAGLLILVYRL